MERKEKINVRIPRNEDNDYHIRLGSNDNNITLDIENRVVAAALHSAIEEMLNPWRPISEPPHTSMPVWVISPDSSTEPEMGYYGSMVERYHAANGEVIRNATHWKEIIKPNLPK